MTTTVDKPKARRRGQRVTAWKDYAAATTVDHFEWWAAQYCVQTIDQFAGYALELERWQKAFLGEALAVDDDGIPWWDTALLVVPRKNGKSTMLAAYALYHLCEDDGQPEVLLAASSDKQAGRLFDYACSFIRQSPAMAAMLHMREYRGEVARADGGGVMKRLAADPMAAHGANPSLTIIDELHTFIVESRRRFYAALTTAGAARLNNQKFAITTAGEAQERDSSILGRMIDGNEAAGEIERPHQALTISRNHESRMLIYNYSAATMNRHDIRAVKQANPSSWVTADYLAKQAASSDITDAAFLQLHACVWADTEDAFIRGDTWDALPASDGVGDGACIGVDGSYTYDTTVVAVAALAEDGFVDVDAHVFSARDDAPHHTLHPGRIRFDDVEAHILAEFTAHRGREIAYDPRYMGRSSEVLEDELGAAVVSAVEPSSKLMRDALATFHRLVAEGKIRHTHDAVIREQILAAKATRDDRGWAVSKRKHHKPIDAVPAIAMAVWRAVVSAEHHVFAEAW